MPPYINVVSLTMVLLFNRLQLHRPHDAKCSILAHCNSGKTNCKPTYAEHRKTKMYAQCSQLCHPKTGTQRPGILYTSLEQIGHGVRNRGSTDNFNLGRRKWTVRRSWVGSDAEGQYLQATSAISFSLEKRKKKELDWVERREKEGSRDRRRLGQDAELAGLRETRERFMV